MNNLNYDVFSSITNERNARILKASNDARLLRSLSKNNETKPEEQSIKASPSSLINILASIFLKREPA